MRRLGSALWRRPSARVPALAPLRRRRRRRRGAPARLSGFTLGLSLRETQTAAFRESGGQAEAAPAQLRRSPREDQGAGREGKARSPIPSLRGGLLSRRAARRPRATPFPATSRGVPGLGDTAREEPGRETAATARGTRTGTGEE